MFRILVVEDDKNTRLLMKAVLEAEHYTVVTAANGQDALAVMDREHIDLVVLDILIIFSFHIVLSYKSPRDQGILDLKRI